MTALWANGMIMGEDENNAANEPEGWSHLPGSVPAHSNLNAERPLLRIHALTTAQKAGKDLDPNDRF